MIGILLLFAQSRLWVQLLITLRSNQVQVVVAAVIE